MKWLAVVVLWLLAHALAVLAVGLLWLAAWMNMAKDRLERSGG